MSFEQRPIPGRSFLRAFTYGEGPPVVLMQFYCQSTRRHFEPAIPTLAGEGFSLVAIDPRGVGSNPGDLAGLSYHDLAADVSAVIEELGVGSVHVIAAAYAAQVARCLASDRPDRVRSLCLIAPGALGEGFPRPPGPETLAVYSRIFFGAEGERQSAIQEATYSPRSGIEARSDDYEVRGDQAMALLRIADATPFAEYWEAGRAPILVLQGTDDQICPPENSRALRRELGSRVQVVEVPEAGHMLAREQPRSLRHAVAFIRRVESSTG